MLQQYRLMTLLWLFPGKRHHANVFCGEVTPLKRLLCWVMLKGVSSVSFLQGPQGPDGPLGETGPEGSKVNMCLEPYWN